MKIIQSFLTKNRCYTAGRKITVKGLMIHSVGCSQPKASAFVSSWNNASASACVHAFIDGNDGTIYQTLPWNHRGWHCSSGSRGSGNDTHIGIEMCEPDCIEYTGSGSGFTCSNANAAKAVVKRTYESAVELFAMLCKQYGLNPLEDGVIISHREGHSRGIASNHADVEHIWNKFGFTMAQFREDVKTVMDGSTGNGVTSVVSGYTDIMGSSIATAEQMRAYIKARNPKVAQSVIDMIPLYLSEGQAEGVRGDIAFAQSCLETGNFTFSGSAVILGQNNFCGMGVTSNGVKGNSFDTQQLGIRAQIQHLKAYASTDSLANDCIDPRFKYIVRGCAEYVEWLGIQENPQRKGWAAGAGYGEKILGILGDMIGRQIEDSPKNPASVTSGQIYKVQVGTFANRANADRLLKKLKKKGYDACITTVHIGKMFYRVQVGAYKVKSNAEATKKKLQKAGFDALIVRA